MHYDLLISLDDAKAEPAEVNNERKPKRRRVKSKDDGAEHAQKQVKVAETAAQKEAAALLKRMETYSDFGHCPRTACQAPLRVLPPWPGNKPKIACPRYRSGNNDGYIRNVRDDEVHLLPNKVLRHVKLQ